MVILKKRWFQCLDKLTWEKFFEIFGRRAKQPAPFFYNFMFFRCAQLIIYKGQKFSKQLFDALISFKNEQKIWLIMPNTCKVSPNQETGLANRGPQSRGCEWYQIDSKWFKGSLMLILDQFDIIQNHASDVPYSPNQFLGWDLFLPSLTARRL